MAERSLAGLLLLLLALLSSSHLSAGIVAYWTMDDDEADSIVLDRAHNRHGVFYNGLVEDSTAAHHSEDREFGTGSLCFDGINDFIEIPDFDYTNDLHEFSLTFWFKAQPVSETATNNGFPYMFSHGITNRNNSLCVFLRASNKSEPHCLKTHTRLADPANIANTSGTGGVLFSYTTNEMLADGNWHHYAISASATKGATIYIDGGAVSANLNYKGAPMNPDMSINLGRRGFDKTRYFGGSTVEDGLLDDVSLRNEALRPEDVLSIFVNGVTPIEHTKAWNPYPDDGADNAAPHVIFSWSGPQNASFYDVYLGNDYNSVADANRNSDQFKGTLDVSFFDPQGLLTDTTYYWAVDTVDANDTIIAHGDVWTFTTAASAPPRASSPMPPHGATRVSTATSLRWQADPNAESHDVRFGTTSPGSYRGNQTETVFYPGTLQPNTIYYWRIDEKNLGGTTEGSIWRFTTGPLFPAQAKNPHPSHAARNVSITTELTWTSGTGAASHDVYFGTTIPGVFQGNYEAETFAPGQLQSGMTYYWRINEKSSGGTRVGPVWSFTTALSPGQANTPFPSEGSTITDLKPVLRWTPGQWAALHRVYFGTDPNSVEEANASQHDTAVFATEQTSTVLDVLTFEPNGLEPDCEYYWRVDEVDPADPNGFYKGKVWSFVTLSSCTQTVGPTRSLGLYKPGVAVPLHDGFHDPPPISRVQGWWQCHASPFTGEEITRELEEFKDKGMGGITIKDTWAMPRDSFTAHIQDIPFMSERWLDMFEHIVDECGRLGLICRSRFGSGWNAGGPWVTSDMSSQIIDFAQSGFLVGPTEYSGPIPTSGGRPTHEALTTGEAFVLGVCPGDGQVVDLTSGVDERLVLTWQVPSGQWVLMSTFSKPSGRRLMSASPTGGGLHHDHLSEAGTDLQIDMLAGRMLDKIGNFGATAFDGFNTDSWEMGNPTWTPGFRQAFISLRGYDPVPYLPIMGGLALDAATDERFLFDYRTTVSDLIVRTHYQRLSAWCRQRTACLEAEAAGGPSHTVPKDLLKAVGAADIPMGELWMHGRAYVKIPSSAAHAYGKRLVSLEWITQPASFFAPSPRHIKRRSDEAFLLGGNYLCSSCVNYSPPEAGLPGWVHAPTTRIDHTDTWWPLSHAFFDYMGRCCFMLQSGQNVAQVAVYRNFQTANGKLWHANADDSLSSFPREYAFDYVNDDIVQNLMAADGGRITLPSGASYQVLYVYPLPDRSMPLATLIKIRELAYAGVSVVWVGPPPEECLGLTDYPSCDEDLAAVVDDLWTSGCLTTFQSRSFANLVPILEQSSEPPAWVFVDDPPLRVVHRRTHDKDVFFVVNRKNEAVETNVIFRISDRIPELWIPETGQIEPARYSTGGSGTSVEVTLPAYGSVFVVFCEGGAPSPQSSEDDGQHAAVTIDGPWEVVFGVRQAASVTSFPTLMSWTAAEDPNIKYYDGVAEYRKTFNCTYPLAAATRATLELGEVKEVCEVWLNRKLVGRGWHPPYSFDISKWLLSGENSLTIRVANLWHNRLVADAGLPKASRVTRVQPESRYNRFKSQSLIESGLLGPIKIVFSEGRPAGDFDGDGDVDVVDFAVLGAAWESEPGDQHWNSACNTDPSNGHIIDIWDLATCAYTWLEGAVRPKR